MSEESCTMKIEIITRNIDDDSLVRGFIQRKVKFALDRMDERVNHVVVTLDDESGNSSAFKGLCQIDAYLKPKGQIHVSADGQSAFDSILQATRKMENAVKRDIQRSRQSARSGREKSKRRKISSFSEHEKSTTDDESHEPHAN